MIGDEQDFVGRMRRVLPRKWFSDAAPVTDTLLTAFGAAWQWLYGLILEVASLARIRTASGPFLDMISIDFFGSGLARKPAEGDISFITRIGFELLRLRASRTALDVALWQLTGMHPIIVEPARPQDTGGYSVGGLAYCEGGAWGSLLLPYACFVTAFRPRGGGIAGLAGFGTGGPIVYGNASMVATPVTDDAIYACVAEVIPLGCTAWTRIENSTTER